MYNQIYQNTIFVYHPKIRLSIITGIVVWFNSMVKLREINPEYGYFLVFQLQVPLCMTAPGNGERRLAKVLLDVYERSGGKLVRPVYDTTDTEDVQFSINLIRAEIDTVKQQLKADVWLVHVRPNEIQF